jgi:hypothetical protein
MFRQLGFCWRQLYSSSVRHLLNLIPALPWLVRYPTFMAATRSPSAILGTCIKCSRLQRPAPTYTSAILLVETTRQRKLRLGRCFDAIPRLITRQVEVYTFGSEVGRLDHYLCSVVTNKQNPYSAVAVSGPRYWVS